MRKSRESYYNYIRPNYDYMLAKGSRHPQSKNIILTIYIYIVLYYFSILFGGVLPLLDDNLSSLDKYSATILSSSDECSA